MDGTLQDEVLIALPIYFLSNPTAHASAPPPFHPSLTLIALRLLAGFHGGVGCLKKSIKKYIFLWTRRKSGVIVYSTNNFQGEMDMKKLMNLAVIATLAASMCFIGCATTTKKAVAGAAVNTVASAASSKSTDKKSESSQAKSTEFSIAYGDYAAMQVMAKKLQSMGYKEGQTITIDGELSKGFSTASIGERKGGMYIGTTLDVKGWKLDDFPEDESRIKVTAKVVTDKENFFQYLKANPSDVKVIE